MHIPPTLCTSLASVACETTSVHVPLKLYTELIQGYTVTVTHEKEQLQWNEKLTTWV